MSQDSDTLSQDLSLELLNSSEEAERQEKKQIAEEEFDPERPEDLLAEPEKAAAAEDEDEVSRNISSQSSEGASKDEEPDSSDERFIDDSSEAEALCENHAACVAFATDVDNFLLKVMHPVTKTIVGDLMEEDKFNFCAYCNDPGYGGSAKTGFVEPFEMSNVINMRLGDKIVFKTRSKVKAGEELRFFYGHGYWQDTPGYYPNDQKRNDAKKQLKRNKQ
jgi:hypothetical protein